MSPPPVTISHFVLARMDRNSMHIPLQYKVGTQIIETQALLDSGAGGWFISTALVRKLGKRWTQLPEKIKVFNVDGTPNKTAWISHVVELEFKIAGKEFRENFMILGIGDESMILGLPWLHYHNPQIDWETEEIRFLPKRKLQIKRFTGILDNTPAEVLTGAKITASQELAHQQQQDYRELNKGTVKNTYPLPLISELLDKLKGANIFMKLDLRNGYNNIRIKNGDQWKAAFKMNQGLFEPTVMFFRLSNLATTSQAFMNDILSDFIDEGWCVIYIDDILLFLKNQKEHQERTERLMRQIRKHDLYFKSKKCEFDVTEVIFLEMVIRPDYVTMDPVKLAGIAEWEPLKTVKGV
uniref:Putative reverse transcriptase-rnase h-integrase n=1 Tax=Moniliophthora roreri TaxID=221103 RepID=A0A0W0GD70_MONRR